ncbi:hypothetical protein IAU60_005900 [Kwoniella sp. DSM 27419]
MSSDTVLNAAVRVYRSVELMSMILERLDNRSLGRILALEKSFFPMCVAVLWRQVPYPVAQDVNLRTPRGLMYAHAIRAVTLVNLAYPKEGYFQMALIASLLDDFPLLRRAYRKSKDRPWGFDWQIVVVPSGVCSVQLRDEVEVLVGDNPVSKLEEGVDAYPDFQVERSIAIRFTPPAAVQGRHHLGLMVHPGPEHDTAKRSWMGYLTSSTRRHRSICAVDFGPVQVTLDEVQRVFDYRHPGHTPVTEVAASNVRDIDIDSFERFCCSVKGDVQVLRLDGPSWGMARMMLLSDLDRIIEAIAQHLPSLRCLELPISIGQRPGAAGPFGLGFVPVTAVKRAKRIGNKLHDLLKVILNIYAHSPPGLHDGRYAFPTDDVACNLAKLGAGPECVYELRNKADVFIGMNVSRAVHLGVQAWQR